MWCVSVRELHGFIFILIHLSLFLRSQLTIDGYSSSKSLASSVNRAMVDPGNGLSPVWRQAIARTNDDLSSIRPIETIVTYRSIKYVRRCLLRKDYHFPTYNLSTHSGRVTHICVSKLCLKCLVAWSAPSHYLKQCWHIVKWANGNKFQLNLEQHMTIFIQESKHITMTS